MIYLIGIFFIIILAMMTYVYFLSQSNKRGKFDVKSITFDYNTLMTHGAELAKNHELSKNYGGVNYLLSRMRENYRYVFNTYVNLIEIASNSQKITGADEWLLDNFYVIEEQSKELMQNIKRNDYKRLPLIKHGQYMGYPRIFALSVEFVSHTDGVVSDQTLIDFLKAYQQTSFLTDTEIWSLSTMLKIALLENIKHLCEHINKTQTQYKQARTDVDLIVNKNKKIGEVLSDYFKNLTSDDFSLIENLLLNFKRCGNEGTNAIRYIDTRLGKLNTSSQNVVNSEHKKQMERQVSIGNAITSLRFVMSLDYLEIFEATSQVEKILNSDPAGVYSNMHRDTKNLYRRQLRRLAKKYDLSEIEVALNAVELAQSATFDDKRHIGYYILTTNLGKNKANSKRNKQVFYGVFIVMLTMIISFCLSAYCYYNINNFAFSVFAFLITLIPSSDIAINIVNYIVTRHSCATIIPRLQFLDGIPDEDATFVVISALLTNENHTKALIRQLETYYLSNKQKNLYFGILSDVGDNAKQEVSKDKELLDVATAEIEKLNEKYENNFFLFHRKRTYNKVDNNYMGWERKRGAIVEFVRLLRGDKKTSFSKIIGDLGKTNKIKYVITLDSDTKLPRDVAEELISAMAHPLNKPIIKGGRVVSGYGIMQPRVDVDVESANTSFFSQVFAGQGGVDTYSCAVSDIYQDLFGEGIFVGKGIFDVDAFHELLPKAIPENTVLSHDLLEGSYLRCGLISNISFIDGFPWKYSAYTSRQHRWTRGDWQLLPWLFRKIKKKYANPLNLLSKWKIIDNLRRSAVPVCLMIILLLSFSFLPKRPTVWVGFALITICMSLLISTIDWTINAGYKFIGQKCHATIIYGLKGVIFQVVLLFVFLPHYAYLSIDAIIRTLYRMAFSHKKMLEWLTAADAERRLENDAISYYKRMISCVVSALILLFLGQKNIYFAIAIATVWIMAPYIAFLSSKKIEKNKINIVHSDRKILLDLAKRTWDYFSDFTNAYDNYLTPDNFQENPPNGIAHRTSPTNIGMQFLAFLSAVDFGFIKEKDALDLIEKTFNTIDKMEKYCGHLYNWYNTKTLEVLKPHYISTVDSGNLIGALITMKNGLLYFKNTNTEAIIKRIDKFIIEMDFKILYDKNRHLFSIGYNVEQQHLTQSYYDLLASEARLASYIAVAKGDVPKKHWLTLGRTLVSRDGYRGLISWTGTMFEYLMPLLLMKNFENTLLDETYHFSIRCQKKYGRKRNVPWGTSESGFNAFDINLNYQYKAFGVPDLGLKRGLISDMVVAPYATVMALMVDYHGAMANIKQLLKLNIYGKYGFYEAIDYTPTRVLPNEKYGVVKSYMVHHLGMSLLSLNNVLNDNILQKRFHNEPIIDATDEFLRERVPTNVVISKENQEKIKPFDIIPKNDDDYILEVSKIDVNNPKIHVMSNGKFSTLITDSGIGYSKFENINVNRFKADLQNGIYGNFVFINNITEGEWWTNTVAPAYSDIESYNAVFSSNKADFFRKGKTGIDTTTEIVVSPEENADIRKITIANNSSNDVILEISNYFEVVLNSSANDSSHMAFSNLFIKTEFENSANCVIASRRPKSEKDETHFAVCTVCVNGDIIGNVNFETDRSKFIGRNKSIVCPNIIAENLEHSGSLGSVLDPIISIKFKVKVQCNSSISFGFITAYADTRDKALTIAHKYQDYSNIERSFEMSWTRSRIENKYLELNSKTEKCAYDMLRDIIYITPYRKTLSKYIEQNKLTQCSLWSLGISGDIPIVTIKVYDVENLDMVKDLLIIHELWRMKGLSVDLVILNSSEHDYNQGLSHAISDVIATSHIRESVGVSGGVFLLNLSLLSEETVNLLYSVSKIVLNSNEGEILSQLKVSNERELIPYISFKNKEYKRITLDLPETCYFNGFGGFLEDEYVIKVNKQIYTPLPWINVIANKDFGFIISESGGGYIWSDNSRENRITPWTNDATTDTVNESIYLRDDVNGYVWNNVPSPIRTDADYLVKHGYGYSEFKTINAEIETTTTVFVPRNGRCKITVLELKNISDEPRSITPTYFVNPVLGVQETETKQHINALCCGANIIYENQYNFDYGNQKVYISSSEKISSYTADKREFFGEVRGNKVPDGLMREKFVNANGSGLDSIVALQNKLELAQKEAKVLVYIVATDKNCLKYSNVKAAMAELKSVKMDWKEKLGKVKVKTPDKSMDLMLNGWLMYQTLSCRIFARSAFYQSGGAYGFRDQLQDVCSILHIDSDIAKQQIIRSSAHQFTDGDVQHWWHQVYNTDEINADKGIRTRFSDDLLWLPYSVFEYISFTDDYDILNIETPFIEDEPLNEDEDERYSVPKMSGEKASIYNHCIRAINRSLKFGSNGLPLMGSGDWNDGMSTVGNKGLGESVWLGWFLYDILIKFYSVCKYMKDDESAEKFKNNADMLKENLNNNAWDGSWYRRAYFDNGQVLGSNQNTECKIDAIAQAWSVISGAGEEEYQKQSMNSVFKHLVSKEDGIIKLLSPPFDNGDLHPGYIKGYVPGVRENGGQYTHASIWVVLAFAKLGMCDVADELFAMINPVNHARTPIEVSTYKVEPYVVSADIYTVYPNVGRGGWSWYTGASGWLYRVGLENILGLKKRGNKLIINPCIAKHWQEYEIEYNHNGTKYIIKITGNKFVEIELLDDKQTHYIDI